MRARSGTVAVALALAVLGAPAAGRAERPELKVRGPRGAVYPGGDKYHVGWQACLECHDDPREVADIRRTAHFPLFLDDRGLPQLSGCEACHGPGYKHVDKGATAKIFSFSELEPRERTRVCMQCHAGSESHVNYARSPHALAEVSCEQCHSVHEPRTAERAQEACFGCHPDVRADYSLPHRHRVEEGVVGCSSCHAIHGGFSRQRLRVGGEDPCGQCHAEQSGPHVFEHVPKLFGGCTGCHSPHGSMNPRQLIRHDVAATCLECHVTTPDDHDQNARWASCTTCHAHVHGSNVDRLFQE